MLNTLFEKRYSACAGKGGNTEDGAVIVIMNNFDLSSYQKLSEEWHKKVSQEDKQNWLHAFTRTIFLLGNVNRILPKYSNDILVANSGIGISKYISNRNVIKGFTSLLPKCVFPSPIINYSKSEAKDSFSQILIKKGTGISQLIAFSHLINESRILGYIKSIMDVNCGEIAEFTENNLQRAKFSYIVPSLDEQLKYKVGAILI